MGTASIGRWSAGGVLLLLIAGAAIQLVPYGRDHSNPAVRLEPQWDAASTRALAKSACFDCHSNETEWPTYSKIAPVSWLVQHDVVDGRAALNFSEWNRPQEEAAEAAEQVLEGEMPPPLYRFVHAEARLSAADRRRLADGLVRTVGGPRRHTDGRERH